MTIYEGVTLASRVERYETALDQMMAAHQDVKGVLLPQILIERWQQVGVDLGDVPGAELPDAGRTQRDLAALNNQIPELSESWTG
jgi:hypothetical protein